MIPPVENGRWYFCIHLFVLAQKEVSGMSYKYIEKGRDK